MAEITCANIAEYTGRELGPSDWLTADQSIINQFAESSGDRQWIHVDVERAKRESPYRGPIAHGYLSLSFVASLSMQVGAIPSDAAAAFNYGLDKVPRKRETCDEVERDNPRVARFRNRSAHSRYCCNKWRCGISVLESLGEKDLPEPIRPRNCILT